VPVCRAFFICVSAVVPGCATYQESLAVVSVAARTNEKPDGAYEALRTEIWSVIRPAEGAPAPPALVMTWT